MSVQHADVDSAPRLLGFLLAALRRAERWRFHWPKARRSGGTAMLDLSTLPTERLRDLGLLDGRATRQGCGKDW